MSAVLDFRELRDKVLAGEMDEDEEPVATPLGEEVKNPATLLGLSAAVGIFGFLGYDNFVNKGSPTFDGTGFTMLAILGGLSLGMAVGGLRRGIEAQTQQERYEKLLDDSQTIIEEQQEEIDAMEAEEEEKEAEEQAEAENAYQYDYLSAEDSFFHGPSLGMGVSAFGQEGVLYRPKDSGSLW